MGWPWRAAMPMMTTFALAPTAVAFPPRSAPRAGAHHRACAGWDPARRRRGPAPAVSWSRRARNGHPISFWKFTKYGALTALVTSTVAWGYLRLRYYAFS